MSDFVLGWREETIGKINMVLKITVSHDKCNRRGLCKVLWKHGRESIEPYPGQEDSIRLKYLHAGDKYPHALGLTSSLRALKRSK